MSGSWIEAKPSAVKVTDKYYDEALHIDVKNLLMLDADRFLAGFRETAGILAGMDEAAIESFMKGKKRYPVKRML
ncbi:hypothetical protein [Butyrivibrio sp. VCB2006]|uniref:hypothetical protein n=1 Tax=Butyrivibrio sp. VCB2006 TaxID=1280679 RepID=UPI0003FA58A5|nr:hypothetical protein [Butyrivibrio sp. VCB2006]